MKYIVAFALFALVAVISADYVAFVQEYPCQTDCYLREPCDGCEAERSAVRACDIDNEVYFPLGKCVLTSSGYRSFKRNNTHINVFEYSSFDDCEENFEDDERNAGLDTDPEDPDKFVPVPDGYDLRIGYCSPNKLGFDKSYMVKFVVDKDLPKDKKLEKGTVKVTRYHRPEEDEEEDAKPTCSAVYNLQYVRHYYNYAEINCSTDTNEIIVSYTDSTDRARQRLINHRAIFTGCRKNYDDFELPGSLGSSTNVVYECGKESSALSIVASLSVIVLAVLSIVHF